MNVAASPLADVTADPGNGMRLRLRDATAQQHRQVEHRIGLLDRAWTAQTYVQLLQAMRGLHAPLERRLAAMGWSGTAIVMRERCKTPWLEADLAHYGFYGTDLAECRDLPLCEDVCAGLGVLYVLEGSTLGGQVILRSLQMKLGISATAGGRFFAGYGALSGARWRSYLAELERLGGSPHDAAVIEQAALQTFAAFDRWLAHAGLARGG
jgi:heme oxygenase